MASHNQNPFEQRAIQQAMEVADERFSFQGQMRDEQANASDRRAFARFSAWLEVSVHSPHNFFTTQVENISEGGLFIATDDDIPIGTVIQVVVHVPGAGQIQADVEVRWARGSGRDGNTPPGIGCRFVQLSDQDLVKIQHFIAEREPMVEP